MDPQQGPPQPDLLIGQTIGNYLVTQKLGEGGMGSVYLAEHPSIGKKVALKVLHAELSSNASVIDRFFNEAKAVNDIGHPNIVDVVDYGVIQAPGRGQLVYFIMEYLAGLTLSQLIRSEAPLPPERALGIALQVADALAASHRAGIVHRDLKPDNIILMTRHRERDFVKLLDFGIAKLTGDTASGSQRTQTGVIMGTPAYMSPEQCDGRGKIDHRADVYALGIVLYEMLTGRVPFVGEGYGEVLVQHLTQPPMPPSQYRMMNAHVEAVVMKALEKRPELRYPTMEEMMRALADPVGFVESHGGIVGFMQRQLMPSTAPLPPIRMTPAPMTTPAPGQIPTPYGLTTPAPTTLGGASGEVAGRRGKTGFVIGGLLVVAAAAAAIVVVMSQNKGDKPDPGTAGSAGSDPEIVAVASGSGSAAGSAGSGSATGSGSGSAEAGSAGGQGSGSAAVKRPSRLAKIKFVTDPPGARIFINGIEMDERTGEVFVLPKSKRAVKVVLRLDSKHEDIVIDDFVVTADVEHEYVFEKKKRPVPHGGRHTGTGKGRGGGKGKGSADGNNGSTTTDTGLMRPDDL
jgi:serine/threonine-protein kinase